MRDIVRKTFIADVMIETPGQRPITWIFSSVRTTPP
jgi:hypothetical protein